MQMPHRGDYSDAMEFMTAMNAWVISSDEAFRHLKEMYENTPEFSERPTFLGEHGVIKHVSLECRPEGKSLDVALNALSGAAHSKGLKPTQLHHGEFIEAGSGKKFWACFAELESA